MNEEKLIHFLIAKADTELALKVEESIFKDSVSALVYQAYKDFIKEFRSRPSEVTFLTHLNSIKIPDTVLPLIQEKVSLYFQPFEDSEGYYESSVKSVLRTKITEKFLRESAKYHAEGKQENIEKATKQLLNSLAALDVKEHTSEYSIYDEDFVDISIQKGVPSPWEKLNAFRESGGFLAPELIVLVGGYKTNKSTIFVELAKGFAFMGKRVLVVDTENGKQNMRKRFFQNISQMSLTEILEDKQSASTEFHDKLKLIERSGGTIDFLSVPINAYELSVVEAKLSKAQEEGKPYDMIFYDYLEQFKVDKNLKDHEKIRELYYGAININQKYNTFSFTPSHINREGLKMQRFGEKASGDSVAGALTKLNDCHAAYLITPIEKGDKVFLEFSIWAQRSGQRKGSFFLEVDASRQTVKQIDFIQEIEVDDD